MKLTITKKDILDAITREPLAPGCWIRPKGYGTRSALWINDRAISETKATQAACEVCAVGAVLRRALPGATLAKIWTVADVVTDADRITGGDIEEAKDVARELLRISLPLNALSVLFESYAETYGVTRKLRTELKKTVRKMFPAEIVVDYKGVEA